MQYTNTTPAAAYVHIANPDDTDRLMTVSVKATFKIFEDGEIELDREAPYPIEMADRETALGVFPQDILPKADKVFEVCVLGCAHAQNGAPVRQMTVNLSVGSVTRTLNVFGDRHWIGHGEQATISEPLPFTSLPLTWANAFGGTAEVRVDDSTTIDLPYGLNPMGKGFDPTLGAAALGNAMNCPSGYPICPQTRSLPNIESPDRLIKTWSDAPKPVCFAPLSVNSPMQLKRSAVLQTGNHGMGIQLLPQTAYRAPDELLMAIPQKRSRVVLDGMTPKGSLSFYLPEMQLFVDYRFGDTEGSEELWPSMLMLLPEEKRFYLVFKRFFSFGFVEEMERSLRIRMARGWFFSEKGAAQC